MSDSRVCAPLIAHQEGDKKVAAAKAEGDARVAAAEKAGAQVAERLKEDLLSHHLLIAGLTEELQICKAAMSGGPVAFDEAKLVFKLEQTADLVGKLQETADAAAHQAVSMSTQLRRISSLDVVRMANMNYFDRMEKAEGWCHKLKTKLDQLIVYKDPDELFRFGLCVSPRDAVLQASEPAQRRVAEVRCVLSKKKTVSEWFYCSWRSSWPRPGT